MSLTLADLIAFNAVLIAAIAAPGAALLYFIKTTVSSGRAAGIATGIGLGTAAAMSGYLMLLLMALTAAMFIYTKLVERRAQRLAKVVAEAD